MGKKKKHEKYVEEVAEINPNIEIIGKYIDNNAKIWHKCKICKSEFERSPNKMLCKNANCPVCSGRIIGCAPEYKNSIWDSKYRDFYSRYMTEEQMKQYMPHSSRKISIICPNCGRTNEMSINNLSHNKFFVCYCSDGKSYPNKFMYSLLDQLKIDYITEYSPDWANKKKYDIYIPLLNCIIENNGEQHYKDKTTFKTTLKQQEENDKHKQNLAMNNNISEYVVIDCRNSNVDFIKNSIINSRLKNILYLNDVDWEACDNFATSSLTKRAIELWNEGLSFSQIKKQINVSSPALRKYLIKGCEMGLCDYSKNKSYSRAFTGEKSPRSLMVYCVELNKVFKTITEASKSTDVHDSAISLCCRNIRKTAGGYKWYYLNDYITKNGEVIKGAISLGLIQEGELCKEKI